MKGNFRYIFLDKSIKYAVIVSIILLTVLTAGLIFSYQFFPPLVPLFNSLPWGEDRLSQKEYIFIVPAFILILLIANTYVASLLIHKRMLLSRMLSLNILLSTILAGIALVQIFILAF